MSMYDTKPVLGYRVTVTDNGTRETIGVQVFQAFVWTIREEIQDMIRRPEHYGKPARNMARMGYLQAAMDGGLTRIGNFHEPHIVRYDVDKYTSCRVEPWHNDMRTMGKCIEMLTGLALAAKKHECGGSFKRSDMTEYTVDAWLADPMNLLRELDRRAVHLESRHLVPLQEGQHWNESSEYIVAPRPLIRAERPAMVEEQALAAR